MSFALPVVAPRAGTVRGVLFHDDGRGNFWAALSSANVFSAVAAMMMTGVAIVSLIYRASPRTPYRFNWDGVALIVMYVGAMVVLYWLS